MALIKNQKDSNGKSMSRKDVLNYVRQYQEEIKAKTKAN